MKIEMGESLAASWLKHSKGCLITQTNWKPSPAWKKHHMDEVRDIIRAAKTYFDEAGFSIISDYDFKTDDCATKIIGAAECDIVGVSFEGTAPLFHTFESAFHRRGLSYGTAKGNAITVLSKFFRSAMCLIACFGVREGELTFASPFVREKSETEILKAVVLLENFFATYKNFEFKFELLFNKDFYKYLLVPVLDVQDTVSDDTELFLRSIQLERLLNGMKENDLKNDNQDKGVFNKIPSGSIKALKRFFKGDDGLAQKIEDEHALYEALIELKGSDADPKGWLQYSLRALYCNKHGIKRITLLDLKKKFK